MAATKKIHGLLLFALLFCGSSLSMARGVYQKPEDFLSSSFQGAPPTPKVLWLTGNLRQEVTKILSHPPKALRIRYWREKQRTAWILEEIGKEKPITVGLVIDKQRLTRIKVLAFRESRGAEVRHPFFTKQFKGITLNAQHQLSQHIDGISGATLSVRALQKLARLALLLNQHASP